ncbi:CPBP family intramembrane glutamic endopeptidase [Planococcus salinarum]|uniref:CPBP family intramembrane glutamic endopeptidase n=1 Tax=Planococcus salinarum TaxID=622695 RepID=UPI000E3C9A8B|nr:CPBP family intramembrane glutamic endopeptidase [Planococcus salinarum]TAA71666.1 CPBP family intramembrane metalloprotease [Planococcus salinarum]
MTTRKNPLSNKLFKNSGTKTKKKTKRTSLYVLLIFIAIQLSPVLFINSTYDYFIDQGLDPDMAQAATSGWLIFIAMGIGLAIALILVFRDKKFFDIWKGKKLGIGWTLLWGIFGFLLLLIGQSLAALIEFAIGIEPGSENTANLVSIAEVVPAAIFAVVLFGPIMEELVFRRVIFGSLNQVTNFWIATAVSAVVFAIVHMEFAHILLYFTTGLILAFLYQKTKRLLAPIIAHILLNGYVMLIQLNMDKINRFIERLEQLEQLQFVFHLL